MAPYLDYEQAKQSPKLRRLVLIGAVFIFSSILGIHAFRSLLSKPPAIVPVSAKPPTSAPVSHLQFGGTISVDNYEQSIYPPLTTQVGDFYLRGRTTDLTPIVFSSPSTQPVVGYFPATQSP